MFQQFQTSCSACGGPGPWSLIRGGGLGNRLKGSGSGLRAQDISMMQCMRCVGGTLIEPAPLDDDTVDDTVKDTIL